MVKFILSVDKPYGTLSIESDNEEELLSSVPRLDKVAKSMDRILVAEIEPSSDVITASKDISNAQKVLVALSIANRPLARKEYIKLSSKLGVPLGWWNGSNFQRDLKKLPPNLVEKPLSNENGTMKLTTRGKRYVNSVLAKKRDVS